MVITIHFLYLVVDVSAQNCTIIPLSPITLINTGGTLVNGTMDVRIQCVCTGSSGVVRWFDPSVTIIIGQGHVNYVVGSPYYVRNSAADALLVIPTFTDSYDGTYNCGIRVADTEFTSPSAAVTLTIGELMINTVSYLYVAT